MSQETHRSWPSKSSWSPEFWRPYVLAIWRQSGSTLSSSKPALLIPWGIYLLRQRWGCWRFKIIWKGHRNVGGLSLIRFVSQRICRYIHMHISLYMYIIFYIYIWYNDNSNNDDNNKMCIKLSMMQSQEHSKPSRGVVGHKVAIIQKGLILFDFSGLLICLYNYIYIYI